MKAFGVAFVALMGWTTAGRVVLPGAAYRVENRAHSGISSLAISPVNGRMWATWYASKTPGEDLNSYVILSTSGDGGNTWKEVLIADPDGEGPERSFDPQVWVAPDGKLRWTWTERRCDPTKGDLTKRYGGDEGDPKTDRLTMAVLDAEQEPAGSVETRVIGRGVMMGKPLALADGTWLFPSAHWNEAPSACFYASTDGGATFTLRGGATIPAEHRLYDEHEAIQRRDGSLLCFIRGNWGAGSHPWETTSTDGGATWSVSATARFRNTSGRIFFRKLKSGNVLLVKNGPIDQDVGRKQITAFLSDDDGTTWKGGLVLDARNDVAYPDGDQFADGTIAVVYDRDRFGAREVLFATFREEDVLAGKNVSGRLQLKRVVTRFPDALAWTWDADERAVEPPSCGHSAGTWLDTVMRCGVRSAGEMLTCCWTTRRESAGIGFNSGKSFPFVLLFL